MMTRLAELWGRRRHNTNPCKNTRRYRMKPKERFLTAEEMARLNAVLTRDQFGCPHVVASQAVTAGENLPLVGKSGCRPPACLLVPVSSFVGFPADALFEK